MPQIQAICGGQVNTASGYAFPYPVMGRAELTDTNCIVHVSNSLKRVSAEFYNLVLAHELAHCRGRRHQE